MAQTFRTTANLAGTPQQALDAWLGKSATSTQLQTLQQALSEVAGEHAELTPGAAQLLQTLHANGTPCAWLDDLPADASLRLAEALPTPIEACWRVRPGRGQRRTVAGRH